ncbi:MAG: c-type cytochrome, partial [Planctomycetes bacterium]|nr:c-type cytochrome [Planctomycetota bacterium]
MPMPEERDIQRWFDELANAQPREQSTHRAIERARQALESAFTSLVGRKQRSVIVPRIAAVVLVLVVVCGAVGGWYYVASKKKNNNEKDQPHRELVNPVPKDDEQPQIVKDSGPKTPDPRIDEPDKPRFVKNWTMADFTGAEFGRTDELAVSRGEQAYVKAQCNRCHIANGGDTVLGPRRSDLAKRFVGPELLQKILDPSREIDKRYQMFAFLMNDGRVVTGLVVGETPAEVHVVTNLHQPQQIARLVKSDIDERVVARTSAMPEGLLNTLSRDEIVDLAAYLESRTGQSNDQDQVVSSDLLLPDTTIAAVIIPDMDVLTKSWDQTQIAALLKDPRMKPFVRSLQRQINDELSKARRRLGIAWEDVRRISTGEVAVGLIQTKKGSLAIALVADVTGNLDRANELLAKVGVELLKEKAKTRQNLQEGDIEIVHYSVPTNRDDMIYHAIVKKHLVAGNHEVVVRDIVKRINGVAVAKGVLADRKSFAISMAKCQQAAGAAAPQILWYIEPTVYAEIMRAEGEQKKAHGKDTLRILKEQGFDAVQALGGHITFSTGTHEVLHHTYIYAPAVEGAEKGARLKGAAAILNFPNAAEPEHMAPQTWIPSWTVQPGKNGKKGVKLSGYTRFNWNVDRAFWAAGKLVDAMVGKDAFKRMLHGLVKDPVGPRIDLPGDIINNLANRASIMSDCAPGPITPQSERWLFALEIKADKIDIVKKTIDKWMEHEPNVVRRQIGKYNVWEMIEEEEVEFDVDIDNGLNFDPLDLGGGNNNNNAADDEEPPLLPNAAVTVAKGHILIASRIDLMKVVLGKQRGALANAADYQRVTAALNDLGAGRDSARMFKRTDEAFRASYGLLKLGDMPKSQSIMGHVLNMVLVPKVEGVQRKQFI